MGLSYFQVQISQCLLEEVEGGHLAAVVPLGADNKERQRQIKRFEKWIPKLKGAIRARSEFGNLRRRAGDGVAEEVAAEAIANVRLELENERRTEPLVFEEFAQARRYVLTTFCHAVAAELRHAEYDYEHVPLYETLDEAPPETSGNAVLEALDNGQPPARDLMIAKEMIERMNDALPDDADWLIAVLLAMGISDQDISQMADLSYDVTRTRIRRLRQTKLAHLKNNCT